MKESVEGRMSVVCGMTKTHCIHVGKCQVKIKVGRKRERDRRGRGRETDMLKEKRKGEEK